jgi:hypothetical protein
MPNLLHAHALVVGIAAYRQVRPLPAVVTNDARAVAELLTDERYCGYLPENVRFLRDEEATRDGLRQSLADLANRTSAESSVFVYFNGHGGRIDTGPQAGQYLIPVDGVYPPGDQLAETAVSGAEFADALRAIPARKVVVVLDCCHAGGIGEPKDALAETFVPGLADRYYDALVGGTGRVIFASSRGAELSWAHGGEEFSVFTKHLLGGLRGGVASDDGLVRVFNLFEYLQPRVTADEPRQHPVFKAEVEENFAVALWQGGAKGTVPKDAEGYRYDAYVSYADREPDAAWVWETLVPRLEGAGLRLAVSGDVEEPGVARVVNVERGITQAKRTIVVLSEAYLADHMAEFENMLAQTMGIEEGTYRLLPVQIAEFDAKHLPVRLGMLSRLNIVDARRSDRAFVRLIEALQGPLPRR